MSFTLSPERLREARDAKGWSVPRLARAVQTGERNIRRWEAGTAEPRVGHLAALATALGQSIEFFLIETDRPEDEEEAA